MADQRIKFIAEWTDKGLKRGLADASEGAKSAEKAAKELKETYLKVTAGIAAAAVAIKKVYEFGKQGAQFNLLSDSVASLGINVEELQDSVGGTVDKFSIMNATATLLAGTQGKVKEAMAGSAQELLKIAKAAATVNPALGSTSFLFESLGTGIKRSSPLILDNLGLTIKVGEANQRYADSIGKTVDQLSAEDKQVALLNETLRAGNVLIEQAAGLNSDAVDAYAEFEAAIKDFGNEAASTFAETDAGTGILGTLTDVLHNVIPGFENLISLKPADWFNAISTEGIKTNDVLSKVVENANDLTAEEIEQERRAALLTRTYREQLQPAMEAQARRQELAYEAYVNLNPEIFTQQRRAELAKEAWDKLNPSIEDAAAAQDDLANSIEDVNRGLDSQIEKWKLDAKWMEAGGLALQNQAEAIMENYDPAVDDLTETFKKLLPIQLEMVAITAQIENMSLDQIQREYENMGIPVKTAAVYAASLYAKMLQLNGMSATMDIYIRQHGGVPSGVPGLPVWTSPTTNKPFIPQQAGGDFIVPASWTGDSYPVRATAGERVQVGTKSSTLDDMINKRSEQRRNNTELAQMIAEAVIVGVRG